MKNHQIHSFSKDVKEQLGYYVYLLLDPDTRQPFYIGKGKGDRIFHHLKDQSSKSEKVQKIDDLRKLGKEPILEILKWGLNEHESLLVESTAIDLLGIDALTNNQRGHGSRHGARSHVNDLELEFSGTARDVHFDEPGILIRISKLWRYGMTDMELYDSTRSYWRLTMVNAERAKYAYAVFDGKIREVYQISAWLPGGSTMICVEHESSPDARLEFVGVIASEMIRKKYLGKDVSSFFSKGAANPCQYVGC
ncbi:MAG: hypothetical protein WCP35_15525 [Verrucomicrobiota bacterium]